MKLSFIILLAAIQFSISSSHELEEEEKPEIIEKVEKIPQKPQFKRFELSDIGPLEIGAVLLLVVYFIHFIWGKEKNYDIVKEWIKNNKDFLNKNFASVGVSNDILLSQESYSCYRSWATGRQNVDFMNVSIDLEARQDVLSFWVLNLFINSKDTIRLEIQLEKMSSLCFAIIRKRELHAVHAKTTDLKFYAKERKMNLANYAVLSDAPEVSDSICTPSLTKILTNDRRLKLLHVTDDHQDFPGKKIIILEYLLVKPKEGISDLVDPLLKALMTTIDIVSSLKLSEHTQNVISDLRKQVEKQKYKATASERQEKQMQRKIDLKKQREEEIAKLPIEQQKKLQEREARREAKQQRLVKSKYR
eukprot:GHVL01024054.1.p1 GENE.GHVL01024054.1~~GHVL01024054.1.p1  ORF type:complete len:361 (+),score=80.82 GHVL01024054.1:50-1132(+)